MKILSHKRRKNSWLQFGMLLIPIFLVYGFVVFNVLMIGYGVQRCERQLRNFFAYLDSQIGKIGIWMKTNMPRVYRWLKRIVP